MKKWILELSSKELQRKSGIYLLSISNNTYIGSSKNLYARLIEHRSDLKKNIHGNDYLQKVFNKHGIKELYFQIISFCEPETRLEEEKKAIIALNPNLNLIKDPTVKRMQPYSKQKLSDSVKQGKLDGKYQTKYDFMEVEQYNYIGDYIKTHVNQKEAAKVLNLSLKRVQYLLGGYRKGVASNGIRLRYKESTVPVQKFEINPRSLSRNLQFFSKDDETEVAFNGIKDIYDFLLQSVIKGKTEITIRYKQKRNSQLGPL